MLIRGLMAISVTVVAPALLVWIASCFALGSCPTLLITIPK